MTRTLWIKTIIQALRALRDDGVDTTTLMALALDELRRTRRTRRKRVR